MKTTRGFHENGDRYFYDFDKCSHHKGWAQIDTEQDASYYGQWAHPTELKYFSYCEGDTTSIECETPEEFVELMRSLEKFEVDQERKPAKIDPMCVEGIEEAFIALGLTDMLH